MSLERAETGAVVVQIEVCDAAMTQGGGELTILDKRIRFLRNRSRGSG